MITSALEAARVSIPLLVINHENNAKLSLLSCHDSGNMPWRGPRRWSNLPNLSSSAKIRLRGLDVPGGSCESWRLAVEAHNVMNWPTVPEECEVYVGNYMLGGQYKKDCALVALVAYDYGRSQNLSADGKDIWVFDVDETVLSHVPYFANHEFGYILFGALVLIFPLHLDKL